MSMFRDKENRFPMHNQHVWLIPIAKWHRKHISNETNNPFEASAAAAAKNLSSSKWRAIYYVVSSFYINVCLLLYAIIMKFIWNQPFCRKCHIFSVAFFLCSHGWPFSLAIHQSASLTNYYNFFLLSFENIYNDTWAFHAYSLCG